MVPSLALGTGEVTLLELTTAYGAFANRGMVTSPRLMTRVEDADGRGIWFAESTRVQAISPTAAFLMSSMLADVVSSGTATAARAAGFSLPAAGKTGTTDDYADAWFVGYTPHLVAGVWFGLDRPAPIMDRGFGGVVAVPAWARFMKLATTGATPDWYPVPADVEKVAICRISGARATEGCRHAQDEVPLFDEALLLAGQSTDATLLPVRQIPTTPPAPPVYEDYFPIGVVPPGLCPIHGDSVVVSEGTRAAPATVGSVPVAMIRRSGDGMR
jgi:membrane carboxypeptidase/penicillin-binding protein